MAENASQKHLTQKIKKLMFTEGIFSANTYKFIEVEAILKVFLNLCEHTLSWRLILQYW